MLSRCNPSLFWGGWFLPRTLTLLGLLLLGLLLVLLEALVVLMVQLVLGLLCWGFSGC